MKTKKTILINSEKGISADSKKKVADIRAAELYATDNFYAELQYRKELLTAMISEKESSGSDVIEGKIHVIQHNKGKRRVQYYLRTNPSDKSGTYIRKGNDELIRTLIQKDYDKKVLKKAKEELYYIEKLLLHSDQNNLGDIYANMLPERQQWIKPVFVSDQEYVDAWSSRQYEHMGFTDDSAVFVTRRGERVRSKSEMLIANLLHEYQIPYLYEFPLRDEYEMIWACPDFTVLNVRERREYYWEHLGMLDNSDYLRKNLKKIGLYESHGMVQGEKLLLSYEASTVPINMKEVDLIIQKFLL